MANPTPLYLWDERSGRFRSVKTGRYISQSRVTAALNDVIDAAAAEMRAASVGLQSGSVTLAQWQLIAEQSIKNINLISYTLARGGFQAMSQNDYGRAGREIRAQYEYLRNLVKEISTGKQPLNGTFLRRIEQYIHSGRSVYEKEKARQATIRGATYMRSVRATRDSCSGCIAQEKLGWIRVDDPRHVPVGGRDCRKNCRCTMETATAEEIGITEAA